MMIFPLVFMRENGGAGELSGGSAWDAAEAGCGDWVAAVVVMIAAAAAVVVVDHIVDRKGHMHFVVVAVEQELAWVWRNEQPKVV